MADIDFSGLSESIAHLGREHNRPPLDEKDLDRDPLELFARWMNEALEAGIDLPNAMTLATAGSTGIPSARMVLLKSVDPHGFVFYSNYESRKGWELAQNPQAALVFYWSRLERQVCVAGPVERLSREESQEYFESRPEGSKLGAWASRQSSIIADREEIEGRLADVKQRFEGEEITIPAYWGGYRLRPERIEFWQSRPNRLHDRFQYTRAENGWRIERLSP